MRRSSLPLFRPDPVMLDRTLAAFLTVGAQLEIWFSNEVVHHRLEFALVAPLITAPIAVRRRYPTLVGIAIPGLGALQYALGRDPQILSEPIAIFSALYALALWTSPRRFAAGFALAMAATFAPRVPESEPRPGVLFTVVRRW